TRGRREPESLEPLREELGGVDVVVDDEHLAWLIARAHEARTRALRLDLDALVDGQQDAEGRAVSHAVARRDDLAGVEAHEVPDDREPESEPALVRSAFARRPREQIEEPRHVLGIDPHAVVPDAELGLAVVDPQ